MSDFPAVVVVVAVVVAEMMGVQWATVEQGEEGEVEVVAVVEEGEEVVVVAVVMVVRKNYHGYKWAAHWRESLQKQQREEEARPGQ